MSNEIAFEDQEWLRYAYLTPVVWCCGDEAREGVVESQSTQTNVESKGSDDPENSRNEEVCEGQELDIISIVRMELKERRVHIAAHAEKGKQKHTIVFQKGACLSTLSHGLRVSTYDFRVGTCVNSSSLA
jgi:hypothetical protein